MANGKLPPPEDARPRNSPGNLYRSAVRQTTAKTA